MVTNGCDQSVHRTLKLTVSQKWTDGINKFFACWYKFRKAKSWFNDFWMGMVKNGHGPLVHETLKSAVSMIWADFLNADNYTMNFGRTYILNGVGGGLIQLYVLFFKDLVDWLRTTYLENGILWRYFARILLVDFRIATYLKSGLSQKYSLRILTIELETSTTKIIHEFIHF